MSKMDTPFGPKSYVVRGKDSNGNLWMTRKFVGPTQHKTLEIARQAAEADVKRMNSMGASAVAVKQRISDDGWMWIDDDPTLDDRIDSTIFIAS